MSERRVLNAIVSLLDGNGMAYLAKIVGESTPQKCSSHCGDENCIEWPILEYIGYDDFPTGERVFHVSECLMTTT